MVAYNLSAVTAIVVYEQLAILARFSLEAVATLPHTLTLLT